MPPITWKNSACEDLNALLRRLAWIQSSREVKVDLKERLTTVLRTLPKPCTPSEMAQKVRQLTAEIEALERPPEERRTSR
jgi:hypothetical protein